MTLLAEYATHPRTYGFQTARPFRQVHGWVPDAVTDTTAKRLRRAGALLGDGGGVLPRLWTLPGHQLFHVVLPLPRTLDFYAHGPAVAKAELRALYPLAPALAQLAYGRSGHLHIHALVALPEGTSPLAAGSFGGLHAVAVTKANHLENLAFYLSRPKDERAARPNRRATYLYTREELQAQRLDAAEMYLEARSRLGRLPHTRWRQNIPHNLWEALPQLVQAPRRPQPSKPRVSHAAWFPVWPKTRQRRVLACLWPCLTLPQAKRAQIPPQARSPPITGGGRV